LAGQLWLNGRVPNLETASSKRRSRAGDILAVLLLLAIVAGMGWLWWQQKHARSGTKKQQPRLEQTIKKPQPNPVIPSLVLVERKPEIPAAAPGKPDISVATEGPPPHSDGYNAEVPVKPTESVPAPVLSNAPPMTTAVEAVAFPRPARSLLEAQIALARRAISPGSIDGAIGSQTRAALAAFQPRAGLFPTSALDTNTQARLQLDAPLFTDYLVTSNDLARLQPLGRTWLAKSQQSALEYETILQLVSEQAHAHPALIQKLNPDIDWARVAQGTVLKIPDVEYPEPTDKAAFVVIHLSGKYLEAFGTESNLLAHFPCSIAAKVEKRPVGELHVAVAIPNPNYTLNPEIFPESAEIQAIGHKLVLPPGPKNPVGVAWIGLDKPGYGMHGTPSPEQIGHTESHGCFRLANWDAAYLLKLVWIGMPVYVEP
jgi:lipoprotein-anchoring transpeptidase ErfK/SrfK